MTIDIILPIIELMIKKTNPVRAAKKFPKSGRYDIIIVMGEKNKSIPTLTKQQPSNLVRVVIIEFSLNFYDII